jgi:aerobic-type carbon monoxide dehydrogenase small subunit (CoxS/CutS family)
VQCGYCINGTHDHAAATLLKKNPKPGVPEIRERAAQNNLCRFAARI